MRSRSTTQVEPVGQADQAGQAAARKAVQVALDRRDNGGDPRAAADE